MVFSVEFITSYCHWTGIVRIDGRIGLSKFFSNLSVCYVHCSCGTWDRHEKFVRRSNIMAMNGLVQRTNGVLCWIYHIIVPLDRYCWDLWEAGTRHMWISATSPDRSIHNPRKDWNEPKHFMNEHNSETVVESEVLLTFFTFVLIKTSFWHSILEGMLSQFW